MSALLKIALPLAILTSCAAVKERAISIEARPVIKEEFGRRVLSAGEGQNVVYAAWPKGGESQLPELDPRKTYRFELIQEYQRFPLGALEGIPAGYWRSDLVRIGQEDRTLYDATICRVHQHQMTRQTLPISYGLPLFSKEYLEARKTRFPNANSTVLGGCSVSPDSAKHSRNFRCERCIQEERAWEEQNPRG